MRSATSISILNAVAVMGPAYAAGILNASPCCNIAQHIRAFLAAIATTAFQ